MAKLAAAIGDTTDVPEGYSVQVCLSRKPSDLQIIGL
jgi:hypothetical protein